MLLSIALILIVGLFSAWIMERLGLPRLMGMILTGILLGPFALNFLDPKLLSISPELRKIALIIILTRAGLTLDLEDLRKIGRPAISMCFLPASLEIIGYVILGPIIFDISHLEAAILGSVIAAVSPAVIVPKMIKLIESGYGDKKKIPQLILAGASVDDVFVIVLFTGFLALSQGENISAISLLNIPISIILGSLIGYALGKILCIFFKKFHIRDTVKILIILSISFILVSLEDILKTQISFSSLISIMALGLAIRKNDQNKAKRLSLRFNKLWIAAEILLFVLVGASVDIRYAMKAGINSLALVFAALIFRILGVYLSLINTDLSKKEKLFCIFSYMPKATVQAAIGGVPLAMGLECGQLILTVAVVSILVTAPLGAFLIDKTYDKFIEKS